METNIVIIGCTLVVLVALFLVYKNSNKQGDQNLAVQVCKLFEFSNQFESTLENIKGFVEESKKKTDENWSMFKDFDSMMNNRQERVFVSSKRDGRYFKRSTAKQVFIFSKRIT